MPDERFCPNCGSTWVEPDTSNRAMIFFSGGDPNRWQCNDCSYTGLMPEGDPGEDLEPEAGNDVEFEPGNNYSRVDLSFGRGYLKYLVYVALPLLLFLVLSRLLQG